MHKLAVIVTTPPHSNLTTTAIEYIHCALKAEVQIIGVFFYQDGVLNASKYLSIASDEYQALTHWQKLHNEYNLPLHVCVTAAEKRGLSEELTTEALPSSIFSNISEAFILSGLGELVELSAHADRVVQF